MSASLIAPSYAAFRSVRSFSSLDGIRSLSIVAVVWHHTTDIGWFPATSRGFLGVDMFFVLSGFLIVTLLLRERETTGQISIRRFYARRTLRIFPIYYGILMAFAFMLMFVKPDANMAAPFFAELPFYATYTSNWIQPTTLFAISWSLAAEEQFYVFWPPVEHFLRQMALPILLGIILLNQLVNFRLVDPFLLNLGLRVEDYPILQATFTPICLGVLLAHLLHSENSFNFAARAFGSRWSSLWMLLVLLAACNVPGNLGGWPRLLIQISIAFFLCTCVVREDHILRAPFSLAPIRRIGVVSYGMYLLHLPARHGAESLLLRASIKSELALFILCLAFTIIAAEASYRFYEKPFLRLKKKFAVDNLASAAQA